MTSMGGLRPWNKYVKEVLKSSDGKVFYAARPQGKVCLVCRNVWKALGSSLSFHAIAFRHPHYSKTVADREPERADCLAGTETVSLIEKRAEWVLARYSARQVWKLGSGRFT